ncbi:MAG: pyridoxamine 5'-phosphate oxidase family protein [Methanomassiliicoccaceae archaeon]|nr:pyridoxamine 5'-phosphate oxidase family protein [Methanomassiliicoccaceae archaeon]
MVKLIPKIADMVKRPETSKVLATVSPEGDPHAVVCGSLLVSDDETIIVGEVYMYATCRNLVHSPKAEFLVWYGREAYSIQAVLTSRMTSGPALERMNHNLEKMKMKAVAVLEFKVLSAYDEGISSDTAGTQIL